MMTKNQASAPRNRTNETSDDNSEGKRPPKMEEILVTGSRIRGAQSASPTMTITAEDIDKAGYATVEHLMQAIPQNFGGGANQENNNSINSGSLSVGAVAGSEVSIDLRGLGTDSTLVLLNGRRLSNGGFDGGFVDISSIPLSAVERVEILTDGASAIYGADAIAGVVNFILKDDFDGAESRLRYGDGADFSDIRFGQLLGKSWDSGNILISYEYYSQDNLPYSARTATASGDLRPLGGDDWRLPGGNPANIIAGGETFAIPNGQDGTSLTPADFVAGTRNFINLSEGRDLFGEQERHSVFITYRHDLSDAAEFFLEPRYSRREATNRRSQTSLNLNVPDSNPFFVDPTATGLTSVQVQTYSFLDDVGASTFDGTIDTYGGATGVGLDLGSDWHVEFSGNYAKEETSTTFRNRVGDDEARAAVAQSTPETAFNPFADGSNTAQTVLDSIALTGESSGDASKLWSLHLDFTGPLFELSNDSADVAAGIEYREESFKRIVTDVTSSGVTFLPGTNANRAIVAAYAELFVPFIGENNARPGLRRLEVSIAGRYEDYNDFGGSADPKLGIVWAPHQSLNLRGTIGTSFKPPLLTELDAAPSTANVDTWISAPLSPVPAIFRFGGNADLTAEEATTWTTSLQFAPESTDLNIELAYFDIDFENRIVRPAPGFAGVFDPEFSSLVNSMPTQEEINAIANSPRFQNIFGGAAQDLIDGVLPVEAIVNFGLANFAKSEVSGLDLRLNYGFDSPAGQFDFGLNGSYLLEFLETLVPTDPPFDRVDKVGNPVDLKLRGSVSWSRNGWGAAAFVNYTDSYTNDQREPGESINSWTTVDAQLSYDIKSSSPLLNDTRVSLSVHNLFDEEPPFVNSDRGFGYDPVNANITGRFLALELNRGWGGR